MGKEFHTIDEYLMFLEDKGFSFGEDAKGFIAFGQGFTGCNDTVVNSAIEITLKIQRSFDGSFFVSLLEALKQHNAKNRKDALQIAEKIGIIQ